MSQFKDKIPAAGGEIKFLYNAKTGGIASQISGTGFMAMYMIAVSMDGRHLLDTVPATGIPGTTVRAKLRVLSPKLRADYVVARLPCGTDQPLGNHVLLVLTRWWIPAEDAHFRKHELRQVSF